MSEILIFSGTTEGRILAEKLSESHISAVVKVATEYGEYTMTELEGISVETGRMNREEMRAFILQGQFKAVVDATHPFATIVSENIRSSMEGLNIPYFRLKRETADAQGNFLKTHGEKVSHKVTYFQSAKACAEYLKKTEGNILLTTGSKDLTTYSQDLELKERIYVRILPAKESLALCEEQGIYGKQIIAMQGPFGEAINRGIIQHFHIQHLVTKESGLAGGYPDKIRAAQKEDIAIYVIGNPEAQQEGDNFATICQKLSCLIGRPIMNQVSLVGIGMGTPGTMTKEVEWCIKEADYILGAPRLLKQVGGTAVKMPYYQKQDILPQLDKLQGMGLKITLLFSGDSGFYSGCGQVYKEILKREDCTCKIYPGISSIAYMAALTGYSWQDAALISIHGQEIEIDWKEKLYHSICYNEKTFVLTSGRKDVQTIQKLLEEANNRRPYKQDVMSERYKMYIGFQLSYPEQELIECTSSQEAILTKDGLYTCLIINHRPDMKYLSHGIKDEMFLRDKVPMTKEEIRDISICKMRLCEGATVYDIGSGSGSIAVEIAKQSPNHRIYAIEKKEEAIHLICQNIEKFHLHHVVQVKGEAPESLKALPAPTHAFIGGTGGNLMPILEALYTKNPSMRVVLNAISLETLAEMAFLKENDKIRDLEIIAVQISRKKTVGNYQLMQGENPVYICSFSFQQ